MPSMCRLVSIMEELPARASTVILRIPAQWLYVLCAMDVVLTVALTLFPPNIQEILPESRMDRELGFAFIVSPLGVRFPLGLLELRFSSSDAPSRSSLQVFENGHPLGPSRSRHDAIRTKGGGRYSYWDENLYFSSSDNTDPRTNERIYGIAGQLVPARWVYGLGLALLVLTGIRRWLSFEPEIQERIRHGLRILVTPTKAFNLPRWLTIVVLLVGLLTGPLVVLVVWHSGATVSLALAGFLPLSDAAGYFWCANDLVDRGTTIDWCHRRPIYSVFLGSLSMVLGRDLHLILLVQAAILSLSVVVFIREVSRWLGILFGLTSGIAVAYFIRDHALVQLMSEVIGLALGILAITILLRAGEGRSPALALVGLVVLSVALNARAGAFFAVPAVLLWIVWIAWQRGAGHWRFLAMGIGVAASGFAVHGLIVSMVGGTSGGSHGNFALTLYGLSVGGNWSTIYTDYPALFSSGSDSQLADIVSGDSATEKLVNAKIYGLAFANILSSPGVFISSLYKNVIYYFASVVLGSIPERWPILDSGVVWILAILFMAWRARWDPRSALVVAFSVGEVASAPLIAIDGGVRVFAVTAAHQILPVVFLARALITRSLRVANLDGLSSDTVRSGWPKTALATTFVIASLFLPSLTPLRNLARSPIRSEVSCAPEYYTVVTRLKTGGSWLSITPRASVPEVWPRRINTDDLKRGLLPHAWFAESVVNLPPVTTILIVRQHHENDYGSERWLYYLGDSELPVDEDLIICVDQTKTRMIAERPFWEIVSFRKL